MRCLTCNEIEFFFTLQIKLVIDDFHRAIFLLHFFFPLYMNIFYIAFKFTLFD